MEFLFQRDLQAIHGIGEQRAELFRKLHINTISDLLRFYPRDYENWTDTKSIQQAELGQVEVIKARVLRKPDQQLVKGGMRLYKTEVTDGEAELHLVFFNNKYIVQQLQEGNTYIFRGKIGGNLLKKEMLSPAFVPENRAMPFHPIYPLTHGLTSKIVAASVKSALQMLPRPCPDPLPEDLRKQHGLLQLSQALRAIHFPKNQEELETAKKRFVFEEFLALQIGIIKIKSGRMRENLHPVQKQFPVAYIKRLPFTLTNAQNRAIKEAVADMAGEAPMNRLIQGDVGSGKTAVAAALCWVAAQAGMQAAFMAPTEILARQHYNSLQKMLGPMGVHITLLTGAHTTAQKREIYRQLETGETQLVIGTHALISDKVGFYNLGLIITDEQHRFGVNQRTALARKGEAPHLLVMSATPIPRTLALLIYGDLDISVLDELPPGRQKIETYLIDSMKRRRALGYIQKHLAQGRQGYMICPLVEGDEDGMASVTEYSQMAQGFFPRAKVGMLHGKMKSAEKDAVMQSFARGEIQLLVATTVVEVGVDVPNAVIMLIENAERYGLSQLHQLRGRVGRGRYKSTCILLSDSQNQETQTRLKILCQTTDGFKIADEDLRLRGPGDFFGRRQHGLPQLKLADMMKDMDVLQDAQQCARELLASGAYNTPAYRYLRAQTEHMFAQVGGVDSLN